MTTMTELREDVLSKASAILEGKQTAAIRRTIRDLYEKVFGEGSYQKIGIRRFAGDPESGWDDDYPKNTGYEILPEDVWYQFSYAKSRLRRWAGIESFDAEEIIAAVEAKLAETG